jgi:hypothetical protein
MSKTASAKKTVGAKKPSVATKKVASVKLATVKKEETPVARVIKGFKILDNVELPARVTTPGESLYPFGEIAVGQSFFVDSAIDLSNYVTSKEASDAQREATATKANRMNGAIRRFLKRNPDFKFTARTVANGRELGFDSDFGVVVKRLK